MTDLPALIIREAGPGDWARIWPLFKSIVAGGDTYAVPPEITEAEGQAYWMGKAVAVYVAELHGRLAGTYCLRANLSGPGSHVANAGYMVDPASSAMASAAACASTLLQRPEPGGSKRCNSMPW